MVCPAFASRARTPRNVTMCEGRSDTAESFFSSDTAVFWLYGPWRGEEHRNVRVSLRLGMGLVVCVGAARNTHPPQRDRGNTEKQTGREGKLAEASREGNKGRKSEE